ncbi:hypothetical protein FNV43_RR08433 [Rhamnella rubrinervis]|uniref:non-specific serine/threonine protein kinase n=1 Tax=Rhamnella rubrinervis TaxID=2594499 RepID=A0A8K0H8L2_9ROSA|nr:hypothetical protein FNV43_RR08433 [Rhamnella rubrinervis]
MFSKLLITLSTLFLVTVIAADEDLIVTYNGFRTANLSLDGIAEFTPNGLLRLTNDTEQQKGHAFYPNPVTFKNSMINSTAFSFSTNFVFAIRSEFPTHSCHGISFVITLTRGLPESLPSYLGLFNETNNGNDTNHVIAVELDTIYSSEFDDINDNHVGIDINGLKSANSSVAGYYEDKMVYFSRKKEESLQNLLKTGRLTVTMGLKVKRVSHESRQGMREFVAEIVRVASGLFYLHEGWEQVVVHRDVKASNVLLDSEFNARLGDFGLARLYDHGSDPQTTHVVGTIGRPIEARRPEDMILVDQVYSCWKEGDILVAKDPKLGFDDVAMSYPYAIDKAFSYASSSVAESSVANDSKENIDAGSSTSLSSEAHVFAQASGKVY